MFGLFNKKKKKRDLNQWELSLLNNVISKLPDDYQYLANQTTAGLFTAALIGYSSYNPDYVAFSFNSEIINDYENQKEKDYKITNIRVWDSYNQKYALYTIYISAGVISGYSLKAESSIVVDLTRIDTSLFVKLYYDNADFKKLSGILSSKDIKLINPNNVYEVSLNGKTFYHLHDLEDGDFIGIDTEKVIYKITHDPYEIIPINDSLEKILKDNTD
jgi:hypothetical protein